MTDEAFEDWFATAKPKDQFVYACHYNLGDKNVSDLTLALAAKMKELFAKGKIVLCQRRTKREDGRKGEFEYLAIKRKSETAPTVFGTPWVPRIVIPGHVPSGLRRLLQ